MMDVTVSFFIFSYVVLKRMLDEMLTRQKDNMFKIGKQQKQQEEEGWIQLVLL